MIEQYVINGKVYDLPELLAQAQVQRGLAPAWEASHWQCILDWMSGEEVVWAKTSGSTGEPKPIALSKKAMTASALATGSFLQIAPDATVLLALPSAYIGGKMMIVRALVHGWKLMWIEPSAHLQLPYEQAIDLVALTPHQVESLVEEKPSFFDSIRCCIIGGAAVSDALREKLQGFSTLFYATYGMTETTSHIALQLLNSAQAQAYFECLQGITVELDSRGCLVIQAPQLCAEPLVTNDMAELISEKTFRILGRIDHVINSGGIKIHPLEVEKKLSTFLDMPFYIGAEPSEKWGQQVVLHLECAPWEKEKEEIFLAQCKTYLTPGEVPKRLIYHAQLNRTETGKIIRR